MGNPYVEIDAVITRWKSGERDTAIDLMKAVVARGEAAPTGYLIERLAEIDDPQLKTVLDEIIHVYGDSWVGPAAGAIINGIRDPRLMRDIKDRLAFEKQAGNQFDWIDHAIHREKAGDHEGALLALRSVAARGGEAAGAYLVDRIADLRDPVMIPFLEELSKNRGDTWLGKRTREALDTLRNPDR
jgi:hypothetical protein